MTETGTAVLPARPGPDPASSSDQARPPGGSNLGREGPVPIDLDSDELSAASRAWGAWTTSCASSEPQGVCGTVSRFRKVEVPVGEGDL